MRQNKISRLITFSILLFLGCDNRTAQEYIQSVKWQYQDNQIQAANIDFNNDEKKVQSTISPFTPLFVLKGTATEFHPHLDFSTFVGDHLLPAGVYMAFTNVKLKGPELLLTQFTVPEKKQIEKLTTTRFVYGQLGNVAKSIETLAEVGRQSSDYYVLQFQLAEIPIRTRQFAKNDTLVVRLLSTNSGSTHANLLKAQIKLRHDNYQNAFYAGKILV
jgi:hypothetical protein